jgi:hypothetical protein
MSLPRALLALVGVAPFLAGYRGVGSASADGYEAQIFVESPGEGGRAEEMSVTVLWRTSGADGRRGLVLTSC